MHNALVEYPLRGPRPKCRRCPAFAEGTILTQHGRECACAACGRALEFSTGERFHFFARMIPQPPSRLSRFFRRAR